MTVIDGVSLFDGVMLLLDYRATIIRRRKTIHCEIAQKLLPFARSEL
jgi:hypothetical protein